MPAPLRIAASAVALAVVAAAGWTAPAWAAGGPISGGDLRASGDVDPVSGQIAAAVQARQGVALVKKSGSAGPSDCLWTSGDFGNFLSHGDQATTRVEPNGRVDRLYAYVCNGTTTFYWVADPDPAQLAQIALAKARSQVPLPDGVFSPNIGAAGGTAFVNAPLRFGVARWAPVASTAAVPGLQATVTAVPTRLVFLPGDGSAPIGCADPTRTTGANSCSYTYHNASTVAPNGQTWPAQLRITWTVTWAATNGAGGTLPPLTTVANYAIRVGEIEAIEQPR